MQSPSFKKILLQRSVLLSMIGPLVVYQVGTARFGLTEMQALLLATIFPLASAIWTGLAQRRLDPIGVFSVVAIVAGVVIGLISNDPRVLLIKESFVTAFLGAAFLVTALAGRPLLATFAREVTNADPARLESPRARVAIRNLSIIWGLGLLGEAAVRVMISFVLPPAVVLTVSPLLAIVVFGGLALITARRAQRARTASAPLAATS